MSHRGPGRARAATCCDHADRGQGAAELGRLRAQALTSPGVVESREHPGQPTTTVMITAGGHFGPAPRASGRRGLMAAASGLLVCSLCSLAAPGAPAPIPAALEARLASSSGRSRVALLLELSRAHGASAPARVAGLRHRGRRARRPAGGQARADRRPLPRGPGARVRLQHEAGAGAEHARRARRRGGGLSQGARRRPQHQGGGPPQDRRLRPCPGRLPRFDEDRRGARRPSRGSRTPTTTSAWSTGTSSATTRPWTPTGALALGGGGPVDGLHNNIGLVVLRAEGLPALAGAPPQGARRSARTADRRGSWPARSTTSASSTPGWGASTRPSRCSRARSPSTPGWTSPGASPTPTRTSARSTSGGASSRARSRS